MSDIDLASIERVDLREVWPNEAANFTPWLAENISRLGEALGLDLELQDTEAAVGGYSLDILATDLNGNRTVVIENQLESTDHNHLGQLLTYAAGLDATVVVWITKEFRDEHRQALDWLNQHTDDETEFFGVAVEAWKIDGSRPAPHFNLVATPNGWRKEAVKRSRGERATSERQERYRAFFQTLIDTLREKHRFTNARKAGLVSWCSFTTGYSRVKYGANFTARREARVEVYLDSVNGERNIRLLEDLSRQRDHIESELGLSLDWEQLENRRACRIEAKRPGRSIDDDESTLAETQTWMIDTLLNFKRVFDPLLARLTKENGP